MKFLVVVLAVLFSQFSYANDNQNSDLMVKTLEEAGVTSWGRRQNLQAHVTCKFNRHQTFRCIITASGTFDNNGGVYKVHTGEEAVFISELLKSFEVYPSGRRMVQEASMFCKFFKQDKVRTCIDQSFDSPVN